MNGARYTINPDYRPPSDEWARLPALVKSSGLFDNLIVGLSQLKSTRAFPSGAVCQFTACEKGDGVSYIVERVAREMGACTGEKVLVIRGERLMTLTSAELKQVASHTIETAHRVFGMQDARGSLRDVLAPMSCDLVLATLRNEFGYVLLDCAALSHSSEAVALTEHSDGTLLVVAAGHTRVSQVEHAHRLIENAAGRLLGCVLNKRTYPIPRFLYKRL